MRVSLKWLTEYVPLRLPADELARRLTLAGVEVGAIERTGGAFEHVYVGEIVRLERHPNADRLQLATVEYGRAAATVVTGASNIKVGDRVPFALVGAELIDFHADPPRKAKLRPTRIRGVESAGMVCSAAELGLGDDHDGILILDPATPVGAPLAEVMGDTVLELELTPNRSDCLAMLGVAQEVAALTGEPLTPPRVRVEATGRPAAERVQIEIEDAQLCRRYSAAVVDAARIGPSPAWLQERLLAAGVRPISNVVDVTNYVMLEYGQPLHAFDFDRIRGRKIVVRRARPGERLRTLDGVDRALDPDVLVIADAEGAVALAGVMGGEESEVSEGTTSILLESATFDPTTVRRTARRLKLPSEASRRFEKGLPTDLTVLALERACQLLQEIAAPGYPEVGRGWADCYPNPDRPRTVRVPYAEFDRLLGVRFEPAEIASVLKRLGFTVRSEGDGVVVDVPFRRVDVGIPADVVEEVARITGYDRLPATRLAGAPPAPTPPDAPFRLEERLRDVLVGCGASEVIAYSLTSPALLDRLPAGETGDPLADEASRRFLPAHEPLRLVNPLSSELSVLRTNSFASMLTIVRDNLRWTDRDVLLFELGRIYLDRGEDLPEERRIATLGSGGYRSGGAWGGRVAVDFYDVKGLVETTLAHVGVGGVTYAAIEHPAFRRGHCAAIVSGDRRSKEHQLIGLIGEVAWTVRRSFDIDEPVFLAALDLERLFPLMTARRAVEPLARLPAVYQDLALVVADDVAAEEIRRAILRAGRPVARDAALFDVYRGDRIGPGRRSLAYRITYQSSERTLTDREVAEAHARIEDGLRKQFGAEVRGR
ncbi:MAG TPA: phenylalanine--tRNA ligase subunit beta [Chloroflexota bacterium]|jgi:phenylalanyl-tRNA synthetase beta chain|nr:phenylalanine--tRNA ligase subunit beta [Chloroflexota bacterium]